MDKPRAQAWANFVIQKALYVNGTVILCFPDRHYAIDNSQRMSYRLL